MTLTILVGRMPLLSFSAARDSFEEINLQNVFSFLLSYFNLLFLAFFFCLIPFNMPLYMKVYFIFGHQIQYPTSAVGVAATQDYPGLVIRRRIANLNCRSPSATPVSRTSSPAFFRRRYFRTAGKQAPLETRSDCGSSLSCYFLLRLNSVLVIIYFL